MLLLEHFPELTQYPFNAKKVMDLVLQLAVQGKLTKKWREEHPDVEPASALLKEIILEKERLFTIGKIKRPVRYPEVYSTDKSFDIPISWAWARFDEIVINRDGERRPITKGDRIKGAYDYYGASGVIDKVSEYLFDKDLLLIGEDGANLVARSTPIAFFARGKYWVNNHAHVLDATHFEVLEYLEKFVNGINLEDYITGMAQPKMPQKRMNLIPVPLPPLEEQKEIVRIVDQLKEEIDVLNRLSNARMEKKHQFVASSLHHLTETGDREHWNLLQDHFSDTLDELDNVKKLRETILQLAVQGKLTQKWRDGHPELVEGDQSAAALLQQIKEEKGKLIAEKKIKREKSLRAINEEEKPYELPGSWEWVRFNDVILEIEAGKSPSCDPTPADEHEWGVIKMSAISWGEFDETQNKRLPQSQEVFTDKEIFSGDFIITRANTKELVAKGVIVPGDSRRKLLLNDKTLRVKLSAEVEKRFLNMLNNSKNSRHYYKSIASGTSDSMKNVSRENIKLLPVALPPFLEQKAIVQQVDHLMSLCDTLETHIRARNETAQQLMKAVVAEVLEGWGEGG